MPVDYKMIGDVISECFESQPQFDGETLSFALKGDGYTVGIIFILSEFTLGSEKGEHYALDVMFWLCDEEQANLDFSKVGWSSLLEMCWKLQSAIDWGTISPTRREDGTVEIALCRCIDLTEDDLIIALYDETASSLMLTLSRLSSEIDQLAPLFLPMLNNKSTDAFADIELYTIPAKGHA